MSEHRDLILKMAEGLADGYSSNGNTCPKCLGGNSRDKSFSVTRVHDGAVYHCFRAKCGFSGFESIRTNQSYSPAVKKKEVVSFRKPTRTLTDEHKTFLKRFNLNDYQIANFRWSFTDDRLVHPIFNFMGYQIGHVSRSYEELGQTSSLKAISYWESHDHPKLHFNQVPTEPTVYLVEDIVSALRLGQFVDTIALLGTNLREYEAQHISRFYRNAVIFLDEDANRKAVKMQTKFSLFFETLSLNIRSEGSPDPKDMTDDEILEAIQ